MSRNVAFPAPAPAPGVCKVGVQHHQVEALWDLKGCAAYLGKSQSWLWTRLRVPPEQRGSIPALRVGGGPRFDPAEIRAWVAAGCPPVAAFRRQHHGEGE